MDSNATSSVNRHRSPIRFSLFTFLLVVTGVCLFLSYRVTHQFARVETSFDLRSHLLNPKGATAGNNVEFLSRTQFVEPTDDRIVAQVVNDPELSGLMIIHGHANPSTWLKQSLEWEIDPGSENLGLQLVVPRGQQEQARRVFVSIFREFLAHAVVDDSVVDEIRRQKHRD